MVLPAVRLLGKETIAVKQPQDHRQTNAKLAEEFNRKAKEASDKIREQVRLAAGNLAFTFYRSGDINMSNTYLSQMDDDQIRDLETDLNIFLVKLRGLQAGRAEAKHQQEQPSDD
jgi:hypothetical protein